MQKIINFIKYHNAFTIGLILIFVFSGAILASEDVRNTVIGKEVVTYQGIDNSAILAANLDDFDFLFEIREVKESDENYYILYAYQTLAIQDYVWQLVKREKTFIVSKADLADQDLKSHVTEEILELLNFELAFLREVQKIEKERGQQFIQKTINHTGLLDLVLDPRIEQLPVYVPVISPKVEQIPAPIIIPDYQPIKSAPEPVTEQGQSLPQDPEPAPEPATE